MRKLVSSSRMTLRDTARWERWHDADSPTDTEQYARLMTSIHGNFNKPPPEFQSGSSPSSTASSKPSPLQATDKQAQVAAAGPDGVLKPTTVKTAPAAGAAKAKAKKGLRRL